MAWLARIVLWAALGTPLWLSIAALPSARAQADDDWGLTRDRPADPKPARRRSGPDVSSEGRELALALRAVERRAAVEQLLAAARVREGGVERLIRDIESRAATARHPGRHFVLLAQLARLQGDPGSARAAFERALAVDLDPLTLRLFAELEREQSALQRARELLSRALALREATGAARLDLLGELLDTCAALPDRACAEDTFAKLAREPGGAARALAYPRTLTDQQAFTRARAAYEALLAGAGRMADAQTRCAIHLELSRLRIAESALSEARAQLELARAPACRAQHAEVLELLLDVQRGLGSLASFARELAASRSPRAQELAGRAFEELGQPAAAAEAYRRALAQAPDDAGLADRLIGLLSREGRVDEVIATYERLLQKPRPEARFLSALTTLLRDSGRSEQAITVAARIGRAQPGDVAIHRLLVELYTRWELPDRARAELEWLTRIDPDEPSHVLALADAELAQGRHSQAATVLRRLRRAAPNAAAGHVRLGQAFADHELAREALAEFDAALRLEPNNLAAMRGRALALARTFRHRDAETQWQRLLQNAAAEPERRRDAREQLVELWANLGELEKRVRDYEEEFGYSAKSGARGDGAPRDPEIGRLLAEGYQRLARQPSYRAQPARYLRGAEDVLGRVVQLDPNDAASWRALERLRSRRGDRQGSIAALQSLVRLEPDRAAEHYMRMAEYAHAAFLEDAAIDYAERAAEAAPQDATVHEWLGDVYRTRRDEERTIQHYQRALELNPMHFSVALRLAELHAQRGERAAAQRLLQNVLRAAAPPALVLRAGRSALQLATTPVARAELERQLLGSVSSDPRRSEHRHVLIELYESLVPDLLAQADDPESEARVQLEAIRVRAQKPLLDALSDGDETQVRSAVRLLRVLGTASAALPLLTLAEGEGELSVRRNALAAACMFGGAELLPRQLALSHAREVRLRDMAAYCLARAPTPASAPALRKLAASETPAVRALAVIGLGLLGGRDQPTSSTALRNMLANDVSALVRGSAALGLGLLGERLARTEGPPLAPHDGLVRETPEQRGAREALDRRLAREALERAVRGPDRAVAESAALSLGLLGEPAAAPSLALAIFDGRSDVSSAAELALRTLECAQPLAFELSEPEPAVASEALIADARRSVSACASRSLEPHFAEITDAVRQTLRGPELPRTLALAWLLRIAPDELGATDRDASWRFELLSSLTTDLAALATHEDAAVRRDVARLLARTPVTAAEQSLLAMVGDPALSVRAAALDALAERKLPDRAAYCERLAWVVTNDREFGMRLRAVLVLGAMQGSTATRVLVRVLSSDPFAVVRESAARALSSRESNLVGEALLLAVHRDAEPRVRHAAARSLRQVGGALLHAALEDPKLDPSVREILQGP